MNYTEKYHLPQWEETDRVMRTDFNQMCQDIESGIDTTKTALEKKIAAAQSTAEELPYVVGSYWGNGKNLKVILGFMPSAVVISKPELLYSTFPLFITRGSNLGELIFENDGFTVIRPTGGSTFHLNELDTGFLYIAFR